MAATIRGHAGPRGTGPRIPPRGSYQMRAPIGRLAPGCQRPLRVVGAMSVQQVRRACRASACRHRQSNSVG